MTRFKSVWKGYLISLLFLVMLFLSQEGMAQLLDPVSYQVRQSPEQVAAGEIFSIQIEATIDGEWHLYSVNNDPADGPYPTQFSSVRPNLLIAGDVTETEPTIVFDPNFQTELGWHAKSALFTVPLAFHPELSGNQKIVLDVLYQVCDDVSCLPPKTKTIESEILLEGEPGPTAQLASFGEVDDGDLTYNSSVEAITDQAGQQRQLGNNGQAGQSDSSTSQPFALTSSSDIASDSIWAFLWLAILAGFAAILTPCVFPLIPLTVSYFSSDAIRKGGPTRTGTATDGPSNTGNSTEGPSVTESPWVQAIMFGLSIVFIFTLLGGLLSLILGVSGVSQFASNPYVNTFIGLIFILFAMSMLGMFELRLPYQLTNWLNKKSNDSGGFIGTLFMALTVSAVSFSCTAPFIGAVLAATTTGEWFAPIIGMIGFSAALSSPFVLFAMFPNWLQGLPKSGAWMNSIKSVLAFIILAASIKFLANADIIFGWGFITRPLGIAAWITFFFLAGLYILGVYGLHGEKRPETLSAGRVMISIPFFLFTFYLLPGLMGANLGFWDAYLPTRHVNEVSLVQSIERISGGGSTTQSKEDTWSSNYEESVLSATENNQPIFIDFTGYTCTNCKAMEANVFPDPNVQELFAQMEKVKLYTDGGSDAEKNQTFQFELTGTLALPTYAIVDPQTGQVLDQLIGYTRAPDFEAFLRQGLDRYDQWNEPN